MKIATDQQDSALILVVDDDKFMRLQLRRALEQAGYQVAEASDGQEALAAYTRLHPDMVLLDAIMPVMDGFTCCRQLQQLPGGDRTPVLMITVLEEQESVELAFDAGAADFINKPIHWEVLRQRVRRLLQASRTMQELQQQIERAQLGEERLSLALDVAHMGTWDWDILTNKLSYSTNLELIFGLSPSLEHPTYETFFKVIHPEDRDRVAQAVIRAVEDGADYGLEFRVILPDGTVRWIEDRGQVYYDNTSKPIRMVGAAMDITERQQAEEELRQNEEFLQRIIRSSPDCIKVLDLEGRLLYMSAGGQSLLEIDNFSSMINSEWVNFWQEFYNQAARAAIETAKAGGTARFQGYCPTAKGTPKWWEVLITPLLDAEGKPEKLLSVSRDITERQRLEAIARTREQELSDFVENASVGMHWVGEDGQILWANQAELDLLGYSREEYIGQQIAKFHADQEVIDDILQRLNANETLHEYEARLLSKDGSIKQVLINSNVFWKDGRFIHSRCFTRDITERKQLEEALQQRIEREQLVTDIAQHIRQSLNLGEILNTTVSEVRQFLQVDRVFIYRFEPDWGGVVTVESVGSAWKPILGSRPKDPHFGDYVQSYKQGRIQATADIYTSDLSQCYIDFLARFQARAALVVPILQGGELWGLLVSHQCSAPRQWQQFEIDLLKQLATQLAIAIQQSTLFEQVQAELVERQQAEAELQRQNLRSQLFADITLKIRQSLQIEEILQTTVTEVQQLLQADRVLIFRLHPNGYGQIITEAVAPDWPSVLNRGITDECFGAEYLKKYSQGRIYTIADIDKAGVEPCLVEFMQQFGVKAKLVMPILFKEELWGLLVAHQCSSPRQWSSFEVDLLRQLADQIGIALVQAQRLEEETRQRQEVDRSNAELQQFASIASHDLQEPLRKIQAFGNRLKVTCGESLTAQGRDYLERMQNAAQRMQALIDDLLILSRITTRVQPFLSVDLAQVTQEVLSDLEVQLQQTNGRVEVEELPIIKADPVQMRQLLQNLISNALKFHRDGEPPVVKVSSQLLDRQLKPVEDAIAEFYQIVVADNGIGFDEKYLDRIFNVFQRLHGRSEYEGTGMGLAICRKIAERHGGSITAKSTPGQGAKFIVTLPTKQPRGEHPA